MMAAEKGDRERDKEGIYSECLPMNMQVMLTGFSGFQKVTHEVRRASFGEDAR